MTKQDRRAIATCSQRALNIYLYKHCCNSPICTTVTCVRFGDVDAVRILFRLLVRASLCKGTFDESAVDLCSSLHCVLLSSLPIVKDTNDKESRRNLVQVVARLVQMDPGVSFVHVLCVPFIAFACLLAFASLFRWSVLPVIICTGSCPYLAC